MQKLDEILSSLLDGIHSNLYFIKDNSHGILDDFNEILVHIDTFIIEQINLYIESKDVVILHGLQVIVNTPEYDKILEHLYEVYNYLFAEITCTLEFDIVGSILQLSVFLIRLGSYMNTVLGHNYMRALEFSKRQLELYDKTEFFTINRDINIEYNINKIKKETLDKNYHVVSIEYMKL